MRILILIFLVFSIQVSAQKSSGDEINPDEELVVYVPNAFTPNSDGVNDVWKIQVSGPQLESFEVVVIDRGGREVFYSDDPAVVWSGITKGGEYLSSPSLFVYYIKLRVVGGTEVKTYRGHVTLVR
jgi:gliding motility-associated-like protein